MMKEAPTLLANRALLSCNRLTIITITPLSFVSIVVCWIVFQACGLVGLWFVTVIAVAVVVVCYLAIVDKMSTMRLAAVIGINRHAFAVERARLFVCVWLLWKAHWHSSTMWSGKIFRCGDFIYFFSINMWFWIIKKIILKRC